MKYGARAIIWGHKVMKGKANFSAVPARLKEKTALYLADKGEEDLVPAADSLILMATVTYTGATLAKDDFTFTLTGTDVSQTKKNAANGKIVFDALNYDDEDIDKTYTLTCKQSIPGTPVEGVTYDKSEYEVKIEPHRNTRDAQDIEFTVTQKKIKDATGTAISSDDQVAADSIAFANIYTEPAVEENNGGAE